MGSKNNPGSYDCYANAHPDEPMMVLLGRDKHAPFLTRLWAILRARDGENEAKVAEALHCADTMEAWRKALGKAPLSAAEQAEMNLLYIEATDGMEEHPKGFEQACGCEVCCAPDAQ